MSNFIGVVFVVVVIVDAAAGATVAACVLFVDALTEELVPSSGGDVGNASNTAGTGFLG
ncbi:hypothetical protein FACS189472_09690 [Alphaproteobacteria bacterium]|nr:hypothetical protein FACS189472_09690 [Alphaproteobacteria bacterium]